MTRNLGPNNHINERNLKIRLIANMKRAFIYVDKNVVKIITMQWYGVYIENRQAGKSSKSNHKRGTNYEI